MTRCDVGNHLGDEEGVEFRTLVLVESIVAGFLLESVETADTCCNNHADTVAVDIGILLDF